MSEKLNKFLEMDIPEELRLSRNLQTMSARAHVSGASPEEASAAILGIACGNIMELEMRLVALEKHLGIKPPEVAVTR